MPDLTTHYLFGKEVLNRLRPEIANTIRKHPNMFHLGAQGPDLFFFRKAITGKSPLPSYGNRLHETKIRETFEFFQSYPEKLRGIEQAILTSYFYGYLCHYFLDKTVHPYVYAVEQEIQSQHPEQSAHEIHAKIESEFDSVLYPHFEKEFVTAFPVKRYFTLTPAETQFLSICYSTLLKQVYHVSVTPREIEKAVQEMTALSRLLYDRTGILYRTSKICAGLIPKFRPFFAHMKTTSVSRDILNLEHRRWQNPNPPEESSYASVLDLFRLAEEEAVPALEQVFCGVLSFDISLNFNGQLIP